MCQTISEEKSVDKLYIQTAPLEVDSCSEML